MTEHRRKQTKGNTKRTEKIHTTGRGKHHRLRQFFTLRSFGISPAIGALIAIGIFLAGTALLLTFLSLLERQADEQQIERQIVEPAYCEGWQNSEAAAHIDVLESGTYQDFSINNSAYVKTLLREGDPESVEDVSEDAIQRIVCSGFALQNADTIDLRSAQLEVSLGAEVFGQAEDVVSVAYTLDGENWQTIESHLISESFGNWNLDGYRTYDFSDILTKETLEDFQIRFSFYARSSAGQTNVYLDGVRFAAETQRKLAVPDIPSDIVQLAKVEFESDEQPTFATQIKEGGIPLFTKHVERSVKSIELWDPKQQRTDNVINQAVGDDRNMLEFEIDQNAFSKPGKYTLAVVLEEDGEEKRYVQSFSWGVLAINPDKAQYAVSEQAHFSIAVLDETGDIVCDADVELQVVNPLGQTTKLSTDAGTISTTDFCYKKEEFQKPDYEAQYMIEHPGVHTLVLSATHANGTFSIEDTFLVATEGKFSIQRFGPTRVYPKVWQPMELRVTAYEDFSGEVTDILPDGFDIEASSEFTVREIPNNNHTDQQIVWNTELSKGQSKTFRYRFKPPDVSPAFYVLGSAAVGDYNEGRLWQLAVDPTYLYLLANTSSGVPAGWSLDTGSDGNYLRAASTAGGTGGNATHTHTFTETVSGGSTQEVISCGGRCTLVSHNLHTHASSGSSIAAANNSPAFHSFYLWKYDTADTAPASIPDNTFVLFDNGSGQPTSPWSRFSSADDRLIKIDSSHTTGGSDTHSHSITWGSLASASGNAFVDVLIDFTPVYATNTHTHTAPATPTTNQTVSLLPEYSTFEIYEQTSGTPQSLPVGMIALFDGTPPSGWTVISDSSPSQDAFLRGSATAGSTGGAASHSHTDTVGTTGGPSATRTYTASGSTGASGEDHTHDITLSSYNTGDHTPPYENYILAEYDGPSGIDISGNVLGTDESTFIGNPPCDGSTAVVSLRVNGGTENTTSCNATTGAYSFTGISASAGDTFTIYLNGAGSTSELANLVMVVGSSNITDADLYENRVIVRDDDNGTLSILDMLDYDNDQNSAQMLFDADDLATDALTVDSNMELHIWAGDTFDPNGTVTTQGTGNLHVEGTAYLDSATSTVAGQILLPSGGDLTISANTNVSNASESIFVSGGTLTISGGTTALSGGLEVDSGTVTITSTVTMASAASGDLDNNGGTVTIDTGADITLGREMCNHAGATLNLNGGTTSSSNTSGGHFRFDGGEVNLQGGTHSTGTDSIVEIARNTTQGCQNDGSRGTVEFNMIDNSPSADGIMATRTYLVYANYTLNTTTVTGGTLKMGTGTTTPQWFDFNLSTHEFYTLQVIRTSNMQVISNNHLDLAGDLIIDSGVTWKGNSYPITVDGDVIIEGTYDADTSTITVGGNWTNNNSFTADTNTVELIGSGSIDGSADTSFYNLTVGDGSAGTVTVNGTDDPTVTNTLDIDTGDALSIGSGRVVTHTGSTFTLDGTVSGAGTMAFASTSPGPGTSGTLSAIARFDATNGNITSSTFDARTYGGHVELYNSGSTSRNVTATASGTYAVGGSFLIHASGTGNITLNSASSVTMNITGDLDFTGAGVGTEQIIFDSGAWNIGGDVDFSNGAILASTETFTFTGNGSHDFWGNSQSIAQLTIPDNTVVVAQSDLTINGTLSITYATGTAELTIQNSVTVTLNTGGTLSFSGLIPSIAGSGTYVHKASVYPTGGIVVPATIRLDATSGNITVNGPQTFSTSATDLELYSASVSNRTIQFGSAGSQSITMAPTVTSSSVGGGSLTIDLNTVDPSLTFINPVTIGANVVLEASNSSTLDVWRDWTNNGTFTHNGGTVRLNGPGAQTLSGSMTSTGSNAFSTLTITNNSGSDISFNDSVEAVSSFSIPQGNTVVKVVDTGSIAGGNFTIAGSSGNYVTLRSLSNGNQWDLDFSGTLSVDYVDVQDSNACPSTNQPVLPTNSIDSGNNTCWTFQITVSGTSNLGSGTVRIAVNSTLDAVNTGTISGGNWSISNVPVNSGDVLTVWVDSQATSNESTGITIAGGGAVAGLVLDANVFTVGHTGTTSLDMADFGLYDTDNDEDIMYSGNSSTINLDAGGPYTSEKFDILANTTVTLSTGETLTTHDLEISSSASLTASGSPTFTVSGALTNAADFNSSSETWNFTSNTTETISLTSASDYDMNNLTFNNASGNWSIDRGLLIFGDLTMTGGTLTLNNSTTVYGSVTGNGTITTTSGTPNFTVLNGGNTFETDGTWTFYDLEFPHSGLSSYTTSSSGTGTINILDNLILDATYDVFGDDYEHHFVEGGSMTFDLQDTGTPVTLTSGASESFLYETSTVQYSGTGSTVTVSALNYYNLWLQPSSTTTYEFTDLATYNIFNDLVISSNTSLDPGTSTVLMRGDGGAIQGGDEDLYNLTITPAGSGTVTIETSDVRVLNDLTVLGSDTLSIDSGRVIHSEGSNEVLGTGVISGSGAIRFYGTSGGPGTTITTYSAVVQFDLGSTVPASVFDVRTYAGDWEIIKTTSAATLSTLASGTYVINGDVRIIDDLGSPVSLSGNTNNPNMTIGGSITFPGTDPFGVIVAGDGTWTVSGDVDFTNGEFQEDASTFVLDGTGYLDTNGFNVHNLTLSGTTTLASDVSVDGDLSMTGSVSPGTNTITMTGTSNTIVGGGNTLYGLVIDPSSAGTITLQTSDVTISNALTIAASDALSIDASRTARLESTGSLTLSGTVSGAGTLEYLPSTAFPSGGTITSVLFMNAYDNNQAMPPRTYGGNVMIGCDHAMLLNPVDRTVTVNSAGTLTFSGDVLVENEDCNSIALNLSSNNPTTTIQGDLQLSTEGIFSAPSSLALQGDYTQTSTGSFVDNSGTVTLAGTGLQTLTGDMTGSSNDFYNMTVTNSSGTDPDSDPSVIFNASMDVTNNFTATTADTKLQFKDGATFSLENISFNGQAMGTRLMLRSTNDGTQWNINSAGTRSVSYTNVKDSNACGQPPDIDASDGTNIDSGNNDCWAFNQLSFSISDTVIGFGTLSSSASRYATGDATGSASEVEAHTIIAASSSAYVITVQGPTLTSPASDTISAIGGSNTAPNPGTEQFGMRLTASGGSGSVSAPYAASGFAYAANATTTDEIASSASSSTDTTYSVRYLGDISTETEAGAYSSNFTYIITPTF